MNGDGRKLFWIILTSLGILTFFGGSTWITFISRNMENLQSAVADVSRQQAVDAARYDEILRRLERIERKFDK